MSILRNHNWKSHAVVIAMLGGLTVCLNYQLTVMGKTPAGGDVASFFMPRMANYASALQRNELSHWNADWGWGFPSHAESQLGTLYPPHWLFFRHLPVEQAYRWNLICHMFLLLGSGYLSGILWGLRPRGALIASIVFACSGFFIIHYPHQWSYTAGAWLPLAGGLTWRFLHAQRRTFWGIALSITLALQMLAGHFQVAFFTQVMVLLIAFEFVLSGRVPITGDEAKRTVGIVGRMTRSLWIPSCLLLGFVLAAGQILPTYSLINVALPEGRDFEYLSGFANSPFHLISFVMPSLFHVNPLWRPFAWDPFHTSPEESFNYVGLVPLCFGLAAAWRFRREPRVKVWVLIVIVSLLFSLGPYVPGYRWLIQLPGFSGFRSASRWSVVVGYGFGLLAGRALQGTVSIRRVRKTWIRFSTVTVVLSVAATTWALAIMSPSPKESMVLSSFQAVWSMMTPWPEQTDWNSIAGQAGVRQGDLRTLRGLAEISDDVASGPLSLRESRRSILVTECFPPVILLIGTSLTLMCCRRRIPIAVIVALMVADLGCVSWLRAIQYAPAGSILARSKVLDRLGDETHSRILDDHQNLAMLSGAAPVQSYRTVDLPILQIPMTRLRSNEHAAASDPLVRFAGIRWIMRDEHTGDRNDVSDAPLAKLIYGERFVDQFPAASQFNVSDLGNERVAWFFPVSELDPGLLHDPAIVRQSDRDGSLLLPLLEIGGEQCDLKRSSSTRQVVEVTTESSGVILHAALAYPGWTANITDRSNGTSRESQVLSCHGCQAVAIPGAGSWTVELTYRCPWFRKGCMISLGGCLIVGLIATASSVAGLKRSRSGTADKSIQRSEAKAEKIQ